MSKTDNIYKTGRMVIYFLRAFVEQRRSHKSPIRRLATAPGVNRQYENVNSCIFLSDNLCCES